MSILETSSPLFDSAADGEAPLSEDSSEVPSLAEGIQLLPFDSSSLEKRYLLVRPDGRRWHVSEYLAAIVRSIDGTRPTHEIAELVAAEIGRPVQASDIERALSGFLTANSILRHSSADGGNVSANPVTKPKASTTFRVRLIWGRPLRLITGCLTWLFSGPLAWPVAAVVVGFQIIWSLVHMRWISIALHMSWAPDLVGILLMLFASMLLHEFGHASACRAFGAKEGEIGFAVYLVFPVFYCDVTDAWKLTRRQRTALDLAGLYLQGIFASALLVIFSVTHRDLYLFTFLAISASYIPNLNPFLKMDGYWFLSDMLGVANLSSRRGELLRGNLSSMQNMSRGLATATYFYLVASLGYLAFFFYWIGRYAITLLSGGYLTKLRTVLMDSFSEPTELIPDLLSFLIATLLLIFLPFVLWRTLRGCIDWVRDIANILRRQRTT